MVLDEVKEISNQKLKSYSDSYQEILMKFIKLTENLVTSVTGNKFNYNLEETFKTQYQNPVMNIK